MSSIKGRVPCPPGTSRMSGGGQSSRLYWGLRLSPPRATIGRLCSAMVYTLKGDGSPRRAAVLKTSNGPAKSSTSTSLKIRIATLRCCSDMEITHWVRRTHETRAETPQGQTHDQAGSLSRLNCVS